MTHGGAATLCRPVLPYNQVVRAVCLQPRVLGLIPIMHFLSIYILLLKDHVKTEG